MRLKKVEIRKYKRFHQPQVLFADGKLTAIVGPNEAGKTSLLNALAHLSDDDSFRLSGDGTEISRGEVVQPRDIVVEALFAVEHSDLEPLKKIRGASQIRWLYVGRRADGEISRRVEPSPRRDRNRRLRAKREIERLERSKWLKALDEEEADSIFDAMIAATDALSRDAENLTSDDLSRLSGLVSALQDRGLDEGPQYGRRLLRELDELMESEGAKDPASVAAEELWKRSPDFLLFRDRDRSLESSYGIASAAEDTPPALDNLCRLAGLDLRQLLSARESEDHGLVTTITESANRRLRQAVSTAWSQSRIDVRLWADGDTLRVQVQTQDQSYWNIADRSDGLRSFVALTAFIAASGREAPILLIDEAEAHLHYDAQADLIQMLYRQELAPQIIYTTHSAGCLPEDLAAVRTIRPDPEAEASEIGNWFWDRGEPGFGPLLMGMGAATLAFVPTRYAAVTEGPSDFILLPSMLRAASGQESLGFQIAPGLSEAKPAEIGALDLQATRVVYIVDNDAAGSEIIKYKLHPAGITDDRIVRVSSTKGWVLEDLLSPDIYARAINNELGLTADNGIEPNHLSTPGSPDVVAKWCDDYSHPKPSKRALAQTIVRLHTEHDIPLLTSAGADQARELLRRLTEVFALSAS
jgi:predicted ATP-dependent endonuclease of OLD family